MTTIMNHAKINIHNEVSEALSEEDERKRRKAIALGYARPLNFWHVSEYPEVKEVVEALYNDFLIKTGRNRKAKDYRTHIRILILDAYVAHQQDPEQYIIYSRRSGSYNTKSRYRYMSYRLTFNVSNFLIEQGYLSYHRGFNNGHNAKRSRIRATEKLIELFKIAKVNSHMIKRSPNEPLVRLKDADKNLIEFTDTDATKEMEAELKEIADTYEQQDVQTNLTPDDIQHLRDYFKQKNRSFDRSTIRLRRTFLNDSFSCGGRLSAGWWQCYPEEYRAKITINGKKVTELDYKSLHPTMLYHKQNEQVPESELYCLEGYPDGYRKCFKLVMLILINAETEKKAIGAIRWKINTEKLDSPLPDTKNATIKALIDDIREQHSVISQYFCSGAGVWLQKKESDINMGILRAFRHKQLPLPLPEYDSFIGVVDQATALKWAMLQSYKEVMGQQFSIGIEKKY
jgi:hypothetical protein